MVDISLRLLNGLPVSIDKLHDAIHQFNLPNSNVNGAFQLANLYFIGSIPKARLVNFRRQNNIVRFELMSDQNRVPLNLEIPNNAIDVQWAQNFIGWQVPGEQPLIITPSTIPFDLMLQAQMPVTPNIKLEYIGKSMAQMAFERLVLKPHKRLAEILLEKISREMAGEESREIIILMFQVSNSGQLPLVESVSEAEMALIKYFNPPYNRIKYKTYPNNESSNLQRYGEIRISIAPNIIFETSHRRHSGRITATYGNPAVFNDA